MNRCRLLILIAAGVFFLSVSYFTTSVFALNLERNVAVHKETIQARQINKKEPKRGLQKDVQLLQQRLDIQDQVIADQNSRIRDMRVSAIRFSTLITIILFFIIGISSWFVAGRKAEMSARKWMDDYAVDFRKEVESLREAFRYHAEKMQKEGDPSAEATMRIINESITAGKKPDISDDARRSLQKESEYLGQVPERQYRAQDWAKLAFAAYADNKLSLTIEYFKSAVNAVDARKSEQARWLSSIGSILDVTKRYEEELAIYDEVISRFGSSTEMALQEQVAKALVNKGGRLGQLHRSEEAIAVSDEVISRFGSSTEIALQEQVAKALVNKGVRLGQLHRSEEAIAVYDEVIRRFGSSTETALQEQVAKTFFNKGVRLGQLHRSEEAIVIYDEVIRRFGSSTETALQEKTAMALFNKGTTLGQLHRSEEAIAVYDEVIRRFGSSTETALQEKTAMALVNKGTTLGQLHRSEEAIAVYDEVIKRFGSSKEAALQEQVAKALVNKEAKLGQIQRSEETMPVSDEVIKRFGSSNEMALQEQVEKALFNKEARLGQIQGSEEIMPVSDEAVNRFDSSMDAALQERAATALNLKGFRLLVKAKQTWDNEIEREKLLRNALVYFDESLRKKNDYSIALGNKGYVLFLMNRTDDAKEALHTALKTGRESLRDTELENAANSTVPEDTAFRELIVLLWDELNVH